MRQKVSALIAIVLALSAAALCPAPASAEDAVANHSIANVIGRPEFAQEFAGFHIYFGDSRHPAGRTIQANVRTSLRTRKLGRSNEEACQWVMLSALIQMRGHARAIGGNAVVNVRSNWRNVEFSSRTDYQCAAGFLMAGVALKGDVVRVR